MNKEQLINELGEIAGHLQYLHTKALKIPKNIIEDIESAESDIELIRVELEEIILKEKNNK